MKYSCTRLAIGEHETNRLENLFYKHVGSAYYFKEFGLDWSFFNDSSLEISIQSFISYFTQEATKQAIIILEISYNIINFTLNIEVKLLNEKVVYLSTNIDKKNKYKENDV